MNARRVVTALLLPLVACGSALDECTAVPLGSCKEVATCCNSTECYFVVDEQTFPCTDGKKCDAAEAGVRAYCAAMAGSP